MGNLFLIGARGAGKTRVGRLLAARLSRPFEDTDETVREAAGKTIAEIFDEEGEEGFRHREREAISALAAREGLVVATGGGAVEDPANVTDMKRSGSVVWLRAPAEVLHGRTVLDEAGEASRPSLTGLDPSREMEAILTRRAPLYRDACDFFIDTGGKSPEEVAVEVEKELGKG